MNIAFIHYHLKTGGVTTVLRRQVEALNGICRVLVLTGEPPKTAFPAETVCIPGLGYTRGSDAALDPGGVSDAVVSAISDQWKAGCDLIHVHNPTVAKNIHFMKILNALQAKQQNLFLQIHDFAEDGRPDAYFSEPYVADCHYGVINSRDYTLLIRAGLKKEGLHRIFNTVEALGPKPGDDRGTDRILYPVRARRRKNIGEAVLLSLFIKDNEFVSITLPPISPVDMESFAGWRRFVGENRLKLTFGEGLKTDFGTLVGSSRYFLTTSITEGFGFSFLEPWTAGKLLWGRKLPEICDDFENSGIRLEHLYDRLEVPIGWLGKARMVKTWCACVEKNASRFGCPLCRKEIREKFDALVHSGTIDFGLLGERFQKEVILRVCSDPRARQKLVSINPFLQNPAAVPDAQPLIAHNRQAVAQAYSLPRYRDTLLSIYEKVKKGPVIHHIDKKKVLDAFFDLTRFSLLKWCDDVG